jgi:DNA polymerase-3 subunit epsilon
MESTEVSVTGHISVQVDLSGFQLPVLAANAQELSAHEDVLTQLDKASGGNTVWRNAEASAAG